MLNVNGDTGQQCDYEVKLEQRAEKRKHLGERNNITTCRSPTRDADTKWIKDERHRKRQDEFLRRRPDDCHVGPLLSPPPRCNSARERVHVTQMSTSHGLPRTIPVKQSVPSASPNDENALKYDNGATLFDLLRQKGKAAQERGRLRDITQATNNHRTLHAASVQTDSGTATVKAEDIQQLTNYLEEALYREEVLKNKLITLQRNSAKLINNTELLWKARCDEDLLKNKIKTLEAQLQLYMTRVPQDELKKEMQQMEKEKEEYEKKALKAIQKLTEENSEAQSKLQNMQEALQVAQDESVRWKKLYEDLKERSNILRRSQDQFTEQLQQLHNELQRSREREKSLTEKCDILQQVKEDLSSTIHLLEQAPREHKKHTENNQNSCNNIREVQEQENESVQVVETGDTTTEQLHRAEQQLKLKDEECMELKAELETLGQECYSYRTRLAQCREEMNTLTARNSRSTKKRCFCSTLCLTLIFMLMLIVVMVAVLVYHPSVKEQLRDFYSAVENIVEDYLMETASKKHAGCFRPV